MTTNSLAPLLYALLGALVLILCLALGHFAWSHARRGMRPLSREFAVRLIDSLSFPSAPKRQWLWDTLTQREMQVAQLVALGRRNAEIAHELSISVRTVETHLQHIYAKLNIRSRTELARAIRELVE
jgi:DNA-binding NarL/FixJ family response regulator